MSNVSRGHDYEREVKDIFVKGGWNCLRAAVSRSGGPDKLDLVAYIKTHTLSPVVWQLFEADGYTTALSRSKKIPLTQMASKIENKYIKHVYWQVVMDDEWIVVLMQCKIRKR